MCEPDPAWEKEMNMLESNEWMTVGVLEPQNSPRLSPPVEVPSFTVRVSGQATCG